MLQKVQTHILIFIGEFLVHIVGKIINPKKICPMKGYYIVLFFIIAICVYSNSSCAVNDTELKNIVKKLGRLSSDWRVDFNNLSQNPILSAKYLIESLHVIKESEIRPDQENKHQESMRVIWCIRALRYITNGKDFKAETNYVFKKNEEDRKYWLTLEDKNRLPFFSTWMSRDIEYIAPVDVQENIIESWKRWYRNEGAIYKYSPAQYVDDWYF